MVLGWTQPLTEMTNTNLRGGEVGKGLPTDNTDNLTAIFYSPKPQEALNPLVTEERY
jgi:hypothetical protein